MDSGLSAARFPSSKVRLVSGSDHVEVDAHILGNSEKCSDVLWQTFPAESSLTVWARHGEMTIANARIENERGSH